MAIAEPVLNDPNGITVKKRTNVSGPLAYADQNPPAQSGSNGPVDPFGGLAMSKPTWDAANTTVQGMVNGSGYSPYATAQDQAFSRAAQNIRAQTGANNAPKIGQGGAVTAQQGVEQNILSGLSTMKNQQAQGEQEMKQSGLSALGQLQTVGQNQGRYNIDVTKASDDKWKADFDTALLYNDPSTPNGLQILQDQYEAKYGYKPDFNTLKEQRDYLKTKQGQDVTTGSLSIDGLKQNLGTDRYNAIANMVNTGATIDQINGQYGAGTLNADQYASMKASAATTIATQQFAQSFGLEQSKFAETARQFNISTDQVAAQFNASLTKDYASLSQQEKQFLASLGLDQQKFEASKDQFARSLGLEATKLSETARQFNMNYDQVGSQFKASLEKDYASLSQQEKQFVASLGLDQAKFEEAKNQFAVTTAVESDRFAKTYSLQKDQLTETARQFNMSTDQAQAQFESKLKLDWASLSQSDKQFMSSLGLDQAKFEESKTQFAQSLGLESKKLDQTAQQFNMTYQQVNDQFKQSLAKDYASLSQQDKQFVASLGLDQAKFDESASQFRQTFEFTKSQWGQDLQLKYDTLAQNKELTDAGVVSNEKIAGLRVSADKDIAAAQIKAASDLAVDRNLLDQQGIDLNKAATFGYTTMPDGSIKVGNVAGGTFKQGQMDIQADRLQMDKDQVLVVNDLAEREMGLNSDKFVEAKRAALKAEELQGDALRQAQLQFNDTYSLSLTEFNKKNEQWNDQFAQAKTEWVANNTNAQTALGMDQQRIDEAVRSAKVSEGFTGLQLATARAEFKQKFGLEMEQFAAQKDQFDKQYTAQKDQFQQSLKQNDRQFLSSIGMQGQELQFKRWEAEKSLGMQQQALDLQKTSAASTAYWDGSEKFATDAATHLDWKTIDSVDKLSANPSASAAAAAWYTAKYGKAPTESDPAYQKWALGELKAATDSRLTNPYDASMYAVNSSGMTAEEKSVWGQVINNPATYGVNFKIVDGKVVIVSEGTEAESSMPVPTPTGGTGITKTAQDAVAKVIKAIKMPALQTPTGNPPAPVSVNSGFNPSSIGPTNSPIGNGAITTLNGVDVVGGSATAAKNWWNNFDAKTGITHIFDFIK